MMNKELHGQYVYYGEYILIDGYQAYWAKHMHDYGPIKMTGPVNFNVLSV